MSEYIFYTTEGFTQAPNGNNVENCQVLGRAFGKNIKEARCNLIKENPWIEEVGFDMEDLFVKQLLPLLITFGKTNISISKKSIIQKITYIEY